MIPLKPLKSQFLGFKIPINNILLALSNHLHIHHLPTCILDKIQFLRTFICSSYLQASGHKNTYHCLCFCMLRAFGLPFNSTERFEIYLPGSWTPGSFGSIPQGLSLAVKTTVPPAALFQKPLFKPPLDFIKVHS